MTHRDSHETVAIALSFVLYYLADHPDVYAKVLKEGNMDKEWMCHSRESETYVVGVDMFLNFAFRNVVTRWGEILCPCRDCVNGMFQSRIACRDHMIIRGFMPNYTFWRVHGVALASSSIQNENDNEPEVAGAGLVSDSHAF
ncbi:hypothetical protein RJ639_036719 [Escallonia herrerae]|uniref:Transposase-associated domain-containing protein n=1 Tax=Escallonia herrerae TaxID=1293975 RepID=A0AA88WQG0_9ASTE|nr:hypothetical protein RJ639_036719 [Escallonia herrerae]